MSGIWRRRFRLVAKFGHATLHREARRAVCGRPYGNTVRKCVYNVHSAGRVPEFHFQLFSPRRRDSSASLKTLDPQAFGGRVPFFHPAPSRLWTRTLPSGKICEMQRISVMPDWRRRGRKKCGVFRVAQLRLAFGLSSKNLHDWAKKGLLLSGGRGKARGWRRFADDDIVAVGIFSAIREAFGVPPEALRWLATRTFEQASCRLAHRNRSDKATGCALHSGHGPTC